MRLCPISTIPSLHPNLGICLQILLSIRSSTPNIRPGSLAIPEGEDRHSVPVLHDIYRAAKLLLELVHKGFDLSIMGDGEIDVLHKYNEHSMTHN